MSTRRQDAGTGKPNKFKTSRTSALVGLLREIAAKPCRNWSGPPCSERPYEERQHWCDRCVVRVAIAAWDQK